MHMIAPEVEAIVPEVHQNWHPQRAPFPSGQNELLTAVPKNSEDPLKRFTQDFISTLYDANPTTQFWRRVAIDPTVFVRDTLRLMSESNLPSIERYILKRSDIFRNLGSMDGKGLPVVLVPGMGGTQQYLDEQADWFDRSNFRVLRPPMFNIGDLEYHVANLESFFIEASREEDILVVAHSLGGIESLLAIKRAQTKQGRRIVHTIITEGTPLNERGGANIFIQMVGAMAVWRTPQQAQQMRRNLEHPVSAGTRFITIGGDKDGIANNGSTEHPDAENYMVPGSHMLPWNAKSYALIDDLLAA